MCFAQQVIPLWEDGIPNQKSSQEKESSTNADILWIENVQVPTLEIYLPTNRNSTGQGVIICPGGGYAGLAYDWEGTDIAKWLNTQGIAAFVLKYRLPNSKSLIDRHEVPLLDARKAITIVRENAESWKLSESNIGIMGFSAGGHLASTLGTQYDSDITRPDFLVLVYPVISLDTLHSQGFTKLNLLGDNPDPSLVDRFSNHLNVNEDTPPTFLVHSNDDDLIDSSNSLLFFNALKKSGVQCEMHLYPYGGHGYSLALDKGDLSNWTDLLASWLHRQSND